jgi:hypothetical protein
MRKRKDKIGNIRKNKHQREREKIRSNIERSEFQD